MISVGGEACVTLARILVPCPKNDPDAIAMRDGAAYRLECIATVNDYPLIMYLDTRPPGAHP